MERNPKNSLHSEITWHSERYQPSSSLRNLSWNHNFCRILHTPSFLVQPWQIYRKLQLLGSQWRHKQHELADTWPEPQHLRFPQQTRAHGSERPLYRCPPRVLEKWRLIVCLQGLNAIDHIAQAKSMPYSFWVSHDCGCQLLFTK